ncbi:MAG: hypothetical protein QM698_17135 [Micropepsaceae bacterium]
MLNASKASRAAANATATGNGAATQATIPTPWDTVNVKSKSEAYRLAMQTTDFVNPKDSTFDKAGVPADHKKLFALYKALSTLQTLTDKAANSKTEPGLLAGLDRRFQTGFAEMMDYARSLTFDNLTMIAGAKNSKAETLAAVSRSSSSFTTRALVQGDATTAMARLENAGPFTITVSRGNATIDVPIDLAGMGSTPRNLGNVVNYINTQLGAAGVQTRLKRVELPAPAVLKANQPTPAKQYAITVEGFASEQLSFSAAAPSPALYLASQGVNAGELRKLDVSGSEPQTIYRTSIETGTDLNIRQTARDAEGNVFVLGTTSGNSGSQINQSARDVMLNKYDSAGNLLWSKLMGATDKADGLALAVDSKGAAVVAGQLTGRISATASAGGLDSYVMKISAAGEEAFVRQVGSALDDGATALTVGPDDAIYVGGTVKGRMLGAAGTVGGADAYVMKFSDTGVRAWTRQFGTAGADKVAAMTIGDDGDLIVASEDDGNAVLRKFSTADATSPAVWTQALGTLGTGGAIGGIAVSAGRIYVAGGTSNGALNGGANLVNSHSGGQDGFLAALTDSGAGVAVDTVSYLGTGAADRINGIAVAGGRIFVAGDTRGTLPGATQTRAGVSNAFSAEFATDGTLAWARQFGVTSGEGYGRGLAADANGASSALDALGLPTGKLFTGQTRTITAQTTARVGDYFEVKVGDNVARRITIAAGETMTTLARKLNAVLVLDGKASVVRSGSGERLRIEMREGKAIELKAGAKGLDALAGLGLAAGPVRKESTTGETDPDALPAFALGFKASYSLGTTASAASAKLVIDSAMAEIRKAYREITMDDETRKLLKGDGAGAKGKTGGPVPAYLTAQLANYSAGLARLNGGS